LVRGRCSSQGIRCTTVIEHPLMTSGPPHEIEKRDFPLVRDAGGPGIGIKRTPPRRHMACVGRGLVMASVRETRCYITGRARLALSNPNTICQIIVVRETASGGHRRCDAASPAIGVSLASRCPEQTARWCDDRRPRPSYWCRLARGFWHSPGIE